MITRRDVDAERSAHRLMPGKGYRRAPRLMMPTEPVAAPETCEPIDGTKDKSIHTLSPPPERDAPPMDFLWHASEKEWEALGRIGKRVAFTSAYLAAHGWTYMRPAS